MKWARRVACVGVEAMGIDPKWIGYLKFCGQFRVGRPMSDLPPKSE
ncbi:MAG: hypothetical protein ACLP59_01230 [Bryobacteraceae bacterium]